MRSAATGRRATRRRTVHEARRVVSPSPGRRAGLPRLPPDPGVVVGAVAVAGSPVAAAVAVAVVVVVDGDRG
jgi:hypothetical protein